MAGWLKIHRQLMHSPVFENEKLFKVFMYCLMKASHKEHEQLVGRQVVQLKPGQFVFGRKKASIETNMSPSTLWGYVLTLKKMGNLDIKSNNKFSVITVVNWAIYQQDDKDFDSKRTTDGQQMDNKWTADEQQMDTNKNVKNGENVKNDNNEQQTNAMRDIITTYEGNGYGTVGSLVVEDFNEWLDQGFEKDAIIHALEIGVTRNNRTMKYVRGIMNNWKKQNTKSLSDIKASENQRSQKNGNSNYELSPEQQSQLDKLPF